ncbi:MAG: flagellar type III secretion system pore protein FliP [Acidobacteriota bacterium]|jgi:flagellar biosynthesis protein FliP
MRTLRNRWVLVICLLLILGVASPALHAQATGQGSLQISLGGGGQDGFSLPVRVILFLTVLTFIPALLISMTSFIRIIVVMHFLRQALGTQQAPNNQILVGLAIFLTLFVMGPTWDRVYDQAIVPYQGGKMTELAALEQAEAPVKDFMLKQVREKDLALFVKIGKLPRPKNREDLPFRVVVPAFMISELQTAFHIGFVLFLPFLVIDMVISAVLLSMGMLQLPPIMISTPFKVLLFILVNGWGLVVGSLVDSFRM